MGYVIGQTRRKRNIYSISTVLSTVSKPTSCSEVLKEIICPDITALTSVSAFTIYHGRLSVRNNLVTPLITKDETAHRNRAFSTKNWPQIW